MKKVFLSGLLAITLMQSCSVTSVTYIEPKKTFVLGEGKHPGYSAAIKNIGLNSVEVSTIDLSGNVTQLDDLKNGQSRAYSIPANTTVTFKNKGGTVTTALNIKLNSPSSDPARLSMGYKN